MQLTGIQQSYRRPLRVLGVAVAFILASSFPSQATETVLRLGHILSGGSNSIHKATEIFAESVSEETGGSVTVNIYPSGQLGEERQLTEGLMLGTIEAAIISTNVLQTFVAEGGITALPYLIRDFNHVFDVEDSAVGDEISDRILNKTGIRIIGHTSGGFRVIATRSKPVQSLADFSGLKIRVPESPVMVATFEALGANPTPIPWGELYTSLQTNVVDAVESPPEILNSANMFEIAKAVSLTNHVYSGQFIAISEKVFQRLTEAEQQAVLKAGREATEWQRHQAVKGNAATLEKIQKDWGVKVYPVDTKPMQEAIKPVYEEYAETIGGTSLIDAIQGM